MSTGVVNDRHQPGDEDEEGPADEVCRGAAATTRTIHIMARASQVPSQQRLERSPGDLVR